MWERILNHEAMNFMVNTTLEEADKIQLLFNLLEDRVEDYNTITALAGKWHKYPAKQQAKFAINYAGVFHASRFILLMDYLNMKAQKGKL